MRSRVFLSCGQAKGTDEADIAHQIGQRIEALGFACYVAIGDQTLASIRENIFRQLELAQYFLFIDFKREQIIARGATTSTHCRGSLFSHQELGLASYLELPCLVFQEAGLLTRDGMLGAFQANAIEFTDRKNLPRVVADVVREKCEKGEWAPDWAGSLSLHVAAKPFADAHQGDAQGPVFRHFHGVVRNNHRSKLALNCYVVLESITPTDGGKANPIDPIEVKWAGSTLPSVIVAANSERRFDAFKVAAANPARIYFNVPWCDSSEFRPLIDGTGAFKFTFGAYSSNFAPAHSEFIVRNVGSLDSIDFAES
jgi:hypothetical protein